MFSRNMEDYELSLDQSCLFIPNDVDESPSCCMSGTFRLRSSRSNSFRSIRLRLTGVLSICRDGFNIRHDRSLGTFERNLVLASTDSLKDLPKSEGTHEFPFKIPLAAKMPASFAGPNHKHHSYEVQVIISRRFKSDIVVSKPLRIYHPPPFDLESLASYQPTDFEGQSDNEIQFRVSVPNQIIPFGSMLPVECWFAPLSKDWKLHTATIAVAQKHSIQLDATAAESSLLHISKVSSTQTYDIFFEKHQLLADDQREDLFFNGLVRLPTSWDSYSQSITSKIITITHSLVVTAEFQSPDGAKSTKIEKSVPISIYMMPELITSDGSIQAFDFRKIQEKMNPPPPYGDHVSDRVIIQDGGIGCPCASPEAMGRAENVYSNDPPVYVS